MTGISLVMPRCVCIFYRLTMFFLFADCDVLAAFVMNVDNKGDVTYIE